MSLLEEIKNEAVDSHSDLGSLLRKCKVMAAKLGSRPLEQWLIWESNGYPPKTELPSNRIWEIDVRGDFGGPFGAAITNAPIPSLCIPAEIRDAFTHTYCRHSVPSMEKMISGDTDCVRVSLGNLSLILGHKVYGGYNCIQAWGQFTTGDFVEALNAVRNRLLDFVLALEKEVPQIGEQLQTAAKIGPERVSQIFYTTVNGNANVLGAAASPKLMIGDSHVGDNYQAGQAGAQGPGAHAHDMEFQQIWQQYGAEIDLKTLSKELGKLAKAMRKEASEPEHEIEIGNISAAEKAAASGDGPKTMQFLKSASKWAIATGTQIGVGTAVAALKAALGL